MARPTPGLESVVAPGVRVPHIEPLQRRIARNRLKLVGLVASFTLSTALSVAVVVGFAASLFALLVIYRLDPDMWLDVTGPEQFIIRSTVLGFVISLVLSAAWVTARLVRSELALVRKLEAVVPKAGTWLATKSALHDVAIAAGIDVPTFYVIDTTRVNAFVLGRSPKHIRIGMTRGMLERIPIEEQRAVLATLVARVLARDTLWATALSAIVGPIAAVREADLRRSDEKYDEQTKTFASVSATRSGDAQAAAGIWFLVYSLAVVVTEIMSWFSREAVWRMAEKSDAEGMLLLKDPKAMIAGIEHVLDRDNHVPSAGEAYSPLFFCWAGFGFAPEDDPEMRRVSRLRETLGAEGAAYVPRPNVPDWSRPPVAPRLDVYAADDGAADEVWP